MSSFELTSIITAVANVIACRLAPDKTALLSTAFVQLGDTLATIAAAESRVETKSDLLQ